MNLKGFKKVHDDEDKAILKNHKGHSITIAKKSLTAKHLKDLDNLPIHAAGGTFAEKMMAQDSEADDLSNHKKEAADLKDYSDQEAAAPDTGTLEPASEPVQRQVAEAPTQPPPQADSSFEPESPQPAQPENPVSANVPPQAQEQRQQAAQQYNVDHATEMGRQDALYAQDLQNGHIKPLTYHQWFENKSLPGKIGTIFGLILSGIGSGMTHQPNTALQMISNELDKEFEAQKKSKENAMNFYRLNLQKEMNKANIAKLRADIPLTKAQTANLQADSVIKADNHTKNQMEISLLNDLQDNVNKLPPGPDKMQKQQAVNGIRQQAAVQMQQRNQQTAKALSNSQQFYENRTQKMHNLGVINPAWETQARNREEREIPGYGTADRPVEQKDRDAISLRQNLLDKTEELRQWSKQHAGSLNPQTINEGNTKSRLVQDLYRQANGEGVFRKGESDFISGIVESHPTKFLNSMRVDPKFNALEKSVKQDIDATTSKYHISPFSDATRRVGQSEVRYDAQGNAWKLGPNGKPVRAR